MKSIFLSVQCIIISIVFGYAQNMANTSNSTVVNHRTLKKLPIVNKKDPVCGMPTRISLEDTVMFNGQIIGFCSKECKNKFVSAPLKYPISHK